MLMPFSSASLRAAEQRPDRLRLRQQPGQRQRQRSRSSSGGWSGSSAAFNDRAQHFVGQNGVAFALDDCAQHAVGGGQHFQYDFVGLDVDDQFVTLDGVARFLCQVATVPSATDSGKVGL
jgi:hypothetical protein